MCDIPLSEIYTEVIMWQDYVLMAGGFLFAVALYPAVKGKEKPPKSTSLLTGSVLLVFSIVYATLGLWLAFASTIITTTMWYILLGQVSRRH